MTEEQKKPEEKEVPTHLSDECCGGGCCDESTDDCACCSGDGDDVNEIAMQAQEYLAGWKRAQADYQNLQKENERQRKDLIQFANAALLSELLPVLNNFKIAWQHLPAELTENEWVKGLGHIKQQLEKVIADAGVASIKTVGEKFNPQLHEAVATETVEGQAPDVIIEEVSAGYQMNDKVLQVARVKVTK